jgi:hypothetical protein
VKTITANDATQANALSPAQRELLAYFDQMDDTSREFILNCAANNARVFPRQRPKLRLVARGAL